MLDASAQGKPNGNISEENVPSLQGLMAIPQRVLMNVISQSKVTVYTRKPPTKREMSTGK